MKRALAIALVLVGCGGTSTVATQPNETVSKMVTAAAGGTVTASGGSIAIPAGALAADTTITVATTDPSSSTPDSTKISGKVFELGPDGTAFTKPVTLTLPLSKMPGTGETAAVSYLDKTTMKWVAVESTTSGGSVSAPIMHFSTWTIIITINGGAAGDCSFTKCGGSVGGTYKITGACLTFTGDNPYQTQCPGATASVDIKVAGSVTLNSDMTYSSDFYGSEATITYTLPASCLGGATDCTKLAGSNSKPNETVTCTGTPSTSCTCKDVTTNMAPAMPTTGTWSTDSSTDQITLSKTGGDMATGIDYCVAGSTLKISGTDSKSGTVTTYIFEKQ